MVKLCSLAGQSFFQMFEVVCYFGKTTVTIIVSGSVAKIVNKLKHSGQGMYCKLPKHQYSTAFVGRAEISCFFHFSIRGTISVTETILLSRSR